MIEKCPICLNSDVPEKPPYETLCGHAFHFECIRSWVKEKKENKNCPLCRTPLANFFVLGEQVYDLLTHDVTALFKALPSGATTEGEPPDDWTADYALKGFIVLKELRTFLELLSTLPQRRSRSRSEEGRGKEGEKFHTDEFLRRFYAYLLTPRLQEFLHRELEENIATLLVTKSLQIQLFGTTSQGVKDLIAEFLNAMNAMKVEGCGE